MKVDRGFSRADREALAVIYWDAFGTKLGRTLGPRARAVRFLARALDPAHAVVARSAAGDVLGLAGFRDAAGGLVGGTWRDLTGVYGASAPVRALALAAIPSDIDNDRFLVDGLAVAQGVRGRGLGSRLIEALARLAAERGHVEMRLHVAEDNPRARALYLRRGFVPGGRRGPGLAGPLLGLPETIVMVRRL